MRILSYISGFIIAAAFLPSCAPKQPNMPNTPVISFNSFQGTGKSSGTLKINFSDGDGDIGHASQDASSQPDLWVKFLYYDTLTKQFIGVANPYNSSTFDSVYFVYNLPDLTPQGKNKATSGIIEIAMNPWYYSVYSDTSLMKVKFQIYLYDRAGNKSNVITSRVLYPGSPTP